METETRGHRLRYFMLAAAAGLFATSAIGIVMAYRFSRRPMVATVCLFAGIAVPAATPLDL